MPERHSIGGYARRALSGCLAVMAVGLNAAAAEPRLAISEFKPASRMETVLSVERFGRYSIQVESEQPVRLRIIDRMSGSKTSPTPGRYDGFFDYGDVKLSMAGNPKGTGTVRLKALPFQERNGPSFPGLSQTEWFATSLKDLESRSYWIELDRPQFFSLEAAGPYLADVRLWQNGEWLQDIESRAETAQLANGQSARVYRLHGRLEAGLYQVTAYGGRPEALTDDAATADLFLRWGVPELPQQGVFALKAGPVGVDRWLVKGPANLFQLTLPEADAAAISIKPYSRAAWPFAPDGRRGFITKEARNPRTVVSVRSRGDNEWHLVTVQRKAGEPYELSYVHTANRYPLKKSGRYWVNTVSLKDPRDVIDATAVVVFDPPGNGRDQGARVIADAALPIGEERPWRSRFNLLSPADVYIKITDPGAYTIDLHSETVRPEFRLQPLAESFGGRLRGRAFRQTLERIGRDWKLAGETWTLEAGIYQLVIRPRSGGSGGGILDMTMRAGTFDKARAADLPVRVRQPVAVFPDLPVRENTMVLMGASTFNQSGLVVRPLPLALNEPLPFAQSDGATVRFPVRTTGQREIAAVTASGSRLKIRDQARGAPWQDSLRTTGQPQTVEVLNDTGEPVRYVLGEAVNRRLSLVTDPPVFVFPGTRSPQAFPFLKIGAKTPLRLERNGRKTFRLRVEDPALYKIESQGLLSTAGVVRTRAVPQLDRVSANGVGRNFLIQQYLRSGDYLVSVGVNGKSTGDLAIAASKTAVLDGGALRPGLSGRKTLEPGTGIRYAVAIDQRARYQIQAAGLNRKLRIRFDDADGWPIMTPGTRSGRSLMLDPGTYHLTVLPEDVRARVVTRITPVRSTAPIEPEAPGPYALGLNERARTVWREPLSETDPRTPDQWTFELADPMGVSVVLSEEMIASLMKRSGDGQWTQVDKVDPIRPSKILELDAGAYRLDVKARRRNNFVTYEITVNTRELPVGQERSIVPPADVPLSLGSDQTIDIASFSLLDVSAKLFDADGRLIARNDDRQDDWNFLISRPLKAGRYTLKVDAPSRGGPRATVISVQGAAERTEPAIEPGADGVIEDNALHIYPLTLPRVGDDAGRALIATTVSKRAHGLAIERQDAGGWTVIAKDTGRGALAAVLLDAESAALPHRLRLWPIDQQPEPIRFSLRMPRAPSKTALDRSADIRFSAVSGTDFRIGRAGLEGPLAITAKSAPKTLYWAAKGGAPFIPVEEGLIPADSSNLWLLTKGTGSARLEALEPIADAGLDVTVPANRSLIFRPRPKQARRAAEVWIARSGYGVPGLRLNGGLGPVRGGSSAIVRLPFESTDAISLHNAGMSGQAMPVSLRRVVMEKAQRAQLGGPLTEVRVEAKSAVVLAAPEGQRTYKIAAPGGLAVIGLQSGRTVDTLWSGDVPSVLSVSAQFDQLWLLNTTDMPGVVTVSAGSATGPLILGSGRYLQSDFESAGLLQMRVEAPGAAATLRVGGAVRSAGFLSADGRYLRLEGRDIALPIDAAGLLTIGHDPGFTAAWIEEANRSAGPWQSASQNDLTEPALVRVRTVQAGIVRVETETGMIKTRIVRPGNALHVLAPQGTVRAFSAPRPGFGALTPELAVQETRVMGEGLGAAVSLMPGDARAFSFALENQTTVGVGVKASRDVVACRLYTEDSDLVGEGIAQMHDLPKGRYFLVASLDAASHPVTIEPALVGTTLPGDGPPDDVRRKYRDLVRPNKP